MSGVLRNSDGISELHPIQQILKGQMRCIRGSSEVLLLSLDAPGASVINLRNINLKRNNRTISPNINSWEGILETKFGRKINRMERKWTFLYDFNLTNSDDLDV